MEPEYFQTRVEAKLNLIDGKFSFLNYGFPENIGIIFMVNLFSHFGKLINS
jgi:hypothetical protein